MFDESAPSYALVIPTSEISKTNENALWYAPIIPPSEIPKTKEEKQQKSYHWEKWSGESKLKGYKRPRSLNVVSLLWKDKGEMPKYENVQMVNNESDSDSSTEYDL